VDNLCHTLMGAACGEAGLKRRTALGNVTLMLASNLPDLDALVFATGMPSVAFRRGWTHGVLAQALLPVACAGVMWFIGRARSPGGLRQSGHRAVGGAAPGAALQRCDFRALLLLSYVGVLSHVALDLLNNYGVRLLMPFSNRWFYGDAVFIIDPWLWLMLGVGVWWGVRRGSARVPRASLAAATLYILAMVVSARIARAEVIDQWRALHGTPPRALMVGPMALTPFRKTVIVDAGDRYETGTFDWTSRHVVFDPERLPKRDGERAVERAKRDPRFRAVLVWSRFPYYTVQPALDGTVVVLRDLRFGNRVGGVATKVTAAE
jgi:inner membrane protein